jgi:hypothetical protein
MKPAVLILNGAARRHFRPAAFADRAGAGIEESLLAKIIREVIGALRLGPRSSLRMTNSKVFFFEVDRRIKWHSEQQWKD